MKQMFLFSVTNPRHVVSAVLPGGAHGVSGQGGPVLQLRGEELQAAGSGRDRLPGRRQARHAAVFEHVRSMAFPPHVHGVALRSLLRGEGGGVAQPVVIRLVRRRQSVGVGHRWSSGVQKLWSSSIFWRKKWS